MKRILTAIILTWALLATPISAPAVDITFWTTEIHKDRLEVINFLIQTFMVMQDDITVTLVSVDENDLFNRAKEARTNGTAPHLVGTGSQLIIALCESGILDSAEATRFVQSLGVDRFYPGSLRQLATPGGSSWCGIPFHGWVQGIWYRADWFRKAGLPPPNNWTAILTAAKHFTDPAIGRYGIVVGTDEDHYSTQIFTQLARSNGASMFDGDGQVVFDSPEMVETLGFYAALAKYGPSGPQKWRARDYFMQGKLAMLFYSTFIMDDIALERVARDSLTANNFDELEGAPFDPDLVRKVRMMPIVRRSQKAGYGIINGFGIRSGLSKEEREATSRFLTFLYDPSHYVTWLHMAPGGMLPVLKDIATSDRFLADPSHIFRRYGRAKIKEIIEGLAEIDTFGLVDGKSHPESAVVYAEGVIPRMIRRTVFKGIPAGESVAQAAKEIQAIADSKPEH